MKRQSHSCRFFVLSIHGMFEDLYPQMYVKKIYQPLMYAMRLTAILRCYLFRASQAWGLQGIMCTDRAWSWRLSNGCMGIPICTFHFISSSLMVVSVAPNSKLQVFSQQLPASEIYTVNQKCISQSFSMFSHVTTQRHQSWESHKENVFSLITFSFHFWPKGSRSLTHSPLH